MFDASPSTRRDRLPGALGERRLVGRVDGVRGRVQRRGENVAAKRLRRLRKKDRLARQCLVQRRALSTSRVRSR